jgi:hypothetical protein
LYGVGIPPPAIVLIAGSVGTITIAHRVRVRAFVPIGLFFVALSLWLIGGNYMKNVMSWPMTVIAIGLGDLRAAVAVEFSRRRVEFRRRREVDTKPELGDLRAAVAAKFLRRRTEDTKPQLPSSVDGTRTVATTDCDLCRDNRDAHGLSHD